MTIREMLSDSITEQFELKEENAKLRAYAEAMESLLQRFSEKEHGYNYLDKLSESIITAYRADFPKDAGLEK